MAKKKVKKVTFQKSKQRWIKRERKCEKGVKKKIKINGEKINTGEKSRKTKQNHEKNGL